MATDRAQPTCGRPDIDLSDFAFELPADRIAQHPPAQRDAGRLMLLDRASGAIGHHRVLDLPDRLRAGDLLVTNATRVRPARLRGRKASGGRAEALLLGDASSSRPGHYRALLRHSGRLRVGARYALGRPRLDAELVELAADGVALLAFDPNADPYRSGEMPLPPYIDRPGPDPDDEQRYQTTFARVPGSVAAPTAGLHFTPRLFEALQSRGVERAEVVLHVGLGTFRPVTRQHLASGRLHAEAYELPEATAAAIARARSSGGRVVAVGTTTTRVLESCAAPDATLAAQRGETRLLLAPGSRFRVVDALFTNFHLPGSSLLLLVAAFAGRERVLAAYAEAVRSGYRFYSYGDAMLIQSVADANR